jgi:hypothetical protein
MRALQDAEAWGRAVEFARGFLARSEGRGSERVSPRFFDECGHIPELLKWAREVIIATSFEIDRGTCCAAGARAPRPLHTLCARADLEESFQDRQPFRAETAAHHLSILEFFAFLCRFRLDRALIVGCAPG